uniref:Twin-arginine translocation signal domain-containing protein n=2 Tax=Cohnella candidum TaxID=2674991 RepID=A0A3G3JZW6_9BACL|nr:twin-arginine translocation signal domain-containing protein [Cohnella candidum]
MGRRQFLTGVAAAGLALLTGGLLRGKLMPVESASASATPTAQPDKPMAVNIRDFGADPTGKKDSSEAFTRALKFIEDSVSANPAAAAVGDPNRRGRVNLYLPEGSYLVTKPEALMRKSYTTRTVGLTIQGAGRGVTQIVYRNSSAGKYMLYNDDAWMFLTIADIEFVSQNAANNFMYSYSEGGAQNYTFERCLWTGSWNEIFRLEGSNTNSEMTWYHCGFSGAIKRAVYVPAAKGSDQFLNYNFFACQFEVSQGDYLIFEKGGNINVWGGSLIHRDDEKGGTFFKLMNGSHANGVQRFLCIGARFEHRNESSQLIDCGWNDGTVSFISCDMSSQAFRLDPAVHAVFRSANQKMPNIKFQECSLMGKHEFRYSKGSWQAPHNVVYENCEFPQGLAAKDFLVYTAEDGPTGGNAGGQPVVAFRNCRSIGATEETAFFDSDQGYQRSNRAQLTKKLISIKDASGALPARGGQEVFRLPLGAVILNVKFLCTAGAFDGSGPADYWLETSESVPSRIAAVQAASAAQGFRKDEDVFFECGTSARCRLKLRAGPGVEPNRAAYCLVEYIG